MRTKSRAGRPICTRPAHSPSRRGRLGCQSRACGYTRGASRGFAPPRRADCHPHAAATIAVVPGVALLAIQQRALLRFSLPLSPALTAQAAAEQAAHQQGDDQHDPAREADWRSGRTSCLDGRFGGRAEPAPERHHRWIEEDAKLLGCRRRPLLAGWTKHRAACTCCDQLGPQRRLLVVRGHNMASADPAPAQAKLTAASTRGGWGSIITLRDAHCLG